MRRLQLGSFLVALMPGAPRGTVEQRLMLVKVDVLVVLRQGQSVNIRNSSIHMCARKSCQTASGKVDQRVQTGVHASLNHAARAFAVSTAPGIIHCAPEHLRRCVTICLQLLSTVPLPIK